MALTAKAGMKVILVLGNEVEVPESWSEEKAAS
ncbi:hypothetical protein LCGC14_2901670, partial [marine sediment metagenome]